MLLRKSESMERRFLREAALTDVGRVRDHNEDSLGVSHGDGLYIVADGMGGHAAGEVASQIAVDSLIDYFEQSREQAAEPAQGVCAEECGARDRLAAGIKLANMRIHEEGASMAEQRGMGTTIVAMHVHGRTAHLAFVGDSRIYRWRDGDLDQMSRDHSWFAELMANAHDLDEDTLAYAERYKNVITRALGMSETVEVELRDAALERGDLYLLCSDGLTDMLDDDAITEILTTHRHDLDECCEQLVVAANEAGGDDNVTVMLVSIDDFDEESAMLHQASTVAEES